jgi:hypothetical protein
MRAYLLGDLVYSRTEILNDGGVPDVGENALLARAGTRGVVVRVGSAEARPEAMVCSDRPWAVSRGS